MSPTRAQDPPSIFSMRRVLESLIVAGIIWLVQAVYTQNTVLASLAAHFDDAARNAALVPQLKEDVGRIDVRVMNNERRLSALEAKEAIR